MKTKSYSVIPTVVVKWSGAKFKHGTVYVGLQWMKEEMKNIKD